MSKNIFPLYVYLESTNHCNATCKICPHGIMEREKGIMSWGLFKKIIDELKQYNKYFQIALHHMGEPLFDPLLVNKIKYIKENIPKLKVYFNTNASLLTEAKSDALIDSGLDKIIFSINGINQDDFDRYNIGLDYNVVKNNIDYFLSKNNNKVKCILQYVIDEKSSNHENEFRQLWYGRNIYIKKMHNYLDRKNINYSKKNKQQRICNFFKRFVIVFWDGGVGICCWDYDNFYKIGNVNNDNLIDLYNNNKYENIRKKMYNFNSKKDSPCERCDKIF